MLLIFPPQAPAFSPHLALPQLTGYLQEHGYESEIIDLNILLYNYLLENFCKKFANDEVKRAICVLQDKQEFYSYNKYLSACQYILWALEVQKEECGYPTRLLSAKYGFSEYSSEEIACNIAQINEKMYPIFYNLMGDKLTKNRLIGISVSYASQLIPALSLCSYIREQNPTAKIILGGSHVTSIYTELQSSCLSSYFDYVINGAGEKALLDIVKQFEKPNILGVDNAKRKRKKLYISWKEMLQYRYFSPELVIPLCVSEGCYWGKCSFCNHESLHGRGYTIATIDEAVNYINKAHEQTGARVFSFVDSVIPFSWLEQIADRLINTKIVWDACVRFDRTNTNFEKLYAGGCRLLRFGLESGSQRVLNLMNKGILLSDVADVLAKCSAAGIATFVFFFTGFPGETKQDAVQTIDFLKDNKKYISFANGGGLFYLGKGSPIYISPKQYNVEIFPNTDYDLSLEIPYSVQSGMSNDEAREMATLQREYVHALNQGPGAIHSKIYDVHDLLYAAHYGASGLKRLNMENSYD